MNSDMLHTMPLGTLMSADDDILDPDDTLVEPPTIPADIDDDLVLPVKPLPGTTDEPVIPPADDDLEDPDGDDVDDLGDDE